MEHSTTRAHLEELRRQLDQIRRGVRGGGQRLLHAAAVAYAGVAAAVRGEDMSEEQWTAVQRVMAGILPEWSGTDLKQRSTQRQIVVRQLWHVAEAGAEYLQEWKLQSAAGTEWLRQREASTGWLPCGLCSGHGERKLSATEGATGAHCHSTGDACSGRAITCAQRSCEIGGQRT